MILKNNLSILKLILSSKKSIPYIKRGICIGVDNNKDNRQTHFGFENVTEREKEEKGIINNLHFY